MLCHFHFDRTTYGDVFGLARCVWALLALCWTTDWNPDKSAGVVGVAVFFLLTRVIGALLDRAEDVEGRARVADDLERLIDTANAPIFGIDTEGRVNEWNQTAAKISGYTKEETMGKNLVGDFIRPGYRASVNRVLKNALRGDETANYEFPLFTKGGARVDVLLNATTRRSASGNIVGVVGVGQDITELKKVAMERERVADDLERLIDSANAPIFGIDVHGRVNDWNRRAAEISGYTKHEAMGKRLVEDFIRPEYRASVQAVLSKALRGVETANYELPLFTKGGARVLVLLNATTRRDAKGAVTGVVGVGQDITQLRAREQELSDKLHFMRLKPLWKISQEQLKCIDNDSLPLISLLRSEEAAAAGDGGGTKPLPDPDAYIRRFCLGKGSFGSVYLGRWHGIPVAVKHCRALPSVGGPRGGGGNVHPAMVYFEQEMDSMSRLRHPNILMCMGVVVDARPIIVTELAERGALNTLLRSARADEAKLGSTHVWNLHTRIAAQAAAGLAHARCGANLEAPSSPHPSFWRLLTRLRRF